MNSESEVLTDGLVELIKEAKMSIHYMGDGYWWATTGMLPDGSWNIITESSFEKSIINCYNKWRQGNG